MNQSGEHGVVVKKFGLYWDSIIFESQPLSRERIQEFPAITIQAIIFPLYTKELLS